MAQWWNYQQVQKKSGTKQDAERCPKCGHSANSHTFKYAYSGNHHYHCRTCGKNCVINHALRKSAIKKS